MPGKHLQWSHWLAGKGYLNQAQVEVDRESEKRAQLSLESAENRLQVYERSTYPRRKLELESQLAAAGQEQERVEAESSATAAERMAQIDAADFASQTRQAELRRVEEQIQHCTVRSPRDGILVYPPSHQHRGGNALAGMSLRPWQTIALLSPLKEFQVRVSLDHSRAGRVVPGQSAEIHVEELPDKSFWGTVEQVKPLSSTLVSAGKNPREILVLVRIDNPSPRLWPEMKATATIDTSAEIRLPGKPTAIETLPVTSGPLVGTVERRSKLELNSSVAIQSEVDGDMIVRSLAPNGARVSKGQTLAQLSSTPLREEFARQSVVVTEAKAAHDLSVKNLKLWQTQGLGNRHVAELAIEGRAAEAPGVSDWQLSSTAQYVAGRNQSHATASEPSSSAPGLVGKSDQEGIYHRIGVGDGSSDRRPAGRISSRDPRQALAAGEIFLPASGRLASGRH